MESLLSLGHGVVPGWAERSATDKTTQREPKTAACAVDVEGFECVRRARRREATRRRAPGERALVRGDQRLHGVTDATRRCRSNASSVVVRAVAAGCAPM